MNDCGVGFRHDEIGCTMDEVRQVLARINDLGNRLGQPKNWFHHRELDGRTLEEVMAGIES